MIKPDCDPCPVCGAPRCDAARLPLLAMIVCCRGTCPFAGPPAGTIIHCKCPTYPGATELAWSI